MSFIIITILIYFYCRICRIAPAKAGSTVKSAATSYRLPCPWPATSSTSIQSITRRSRPPWSRRSLANFMSAAATFVTQSSTAETAFAITSSVDIQTTSQRRTSPLSAASARAPSTRPSCTTETTYIIHRKTCKSSSQQQLAEVSSVSSIQCEFCATTFQTRGSYYSHANVLHKELIVAANWIHCQSCDKHISPGSF